jgi:hypothetical protein
VARVTAGGFDLRGPNGTTAPVDMTDPTVEVVVVMRRQPDGTLAAALGVKDPSAVDRDEVADALEDLADNLALPAAYKELGFRG